MPNRIVLTPKGTRIVQLARVRNNGVIHHSKCWYLRLWSAKRARYFSLGRAFPAAAKKADQIRAAMASGLMGVEECFSKFCGGQIARVERSECATIGQVVDTMEKERVALNLLEASTSEYRRSILLMVRTVYNARAMGKRKYTDEDIRLESLLVLTRSLVAEFRKIRLQDVGDQRKILSAKRSANRHVRNAKAVFKESAVEHYRTSDLVIPNLGDFKSAPLFERVGITYFLPSSALISEVAALILKELEGRSQNEFLCALLALHAGLRDGEIVKARWDWVRAEQDPYLLVSVEEDFLPKNKKGRRIPLQPWVFDILKKYRAKDSDYILTGIPDERESETLRRLCRWLRDKGVLVGKPIHELRKWFGSFVASELGLTRAQSILGHKSHQTTQDYYADLDFPPTLKRVWQGEVKKRLRPKSG